MGVQINGDTGNVIATKGTFSGDVGIGGTLTYEDVTNVDSVGLITARQGIKIGSGVGVAASISVDGNAEFAGIVTASSFVGSGANLTGVASTDNIRTNTNATFLKNINVSGIATVGSAVTISESGIDASGIGITCANINGTQIGGRRNFIINGAMQVWQRGTSFDSQGNGQNDYTTDRFAIGHNDSHMAAVTQQDGTGADAKFQYCARVQRDSGNSQTEQMRFHTALETKDVILLRGETLTISYYARKGANYSEANSQINQLRIATGENTDGDPNAYSGGSWTNATTILNETATLTTSWQRFSHTTSAVSSSANSMIIEFRNTPVGTAGANDYYEITGVQLEVGSQATAFEHRSYAEELTLCQRYFQIWERGYLAANAVGSSDLYIGVPLTTPLRTTPTTNSGFSMHRNGNQTNTVSFVSATYQTNSIILEVRMSGFSVSDEVAYNVTCVGGSDRMEISAEL